MAFLKVFLLVIFCLWFVQSFGQSCDCPPAVSCGSCVGGLTSLTLRFNGASASTITASDQRGEVYNNSVAPGATFTFDGSIPNDKFVGPTITITVNGITNATIKSNCAGGTFVGSVYGSFTVVAGSSLNGGSICCDADDVDTEFPVISNCPTTITRSLVSGCTIAVSWTPPTASDNCSVASFINPIVPGSEFGLGTTPVTYTATDTYGNTATCTFDVVVTDNILPTFSGCPSNITVPAGANCKAIATWTSPTSGDNCGLASTIGSHASGSEFEIGPTTVSYTATDINGNSSTCVFTVTVTYTEAPEVTGCPADLTGISDDTDEAVVTWIEPVFTTRCGTLAIQKSHEPGSRFRTGITEVVYTASDGLGNTTECRFGVNVDLSELEIQISKLVTPDGDGFNDFWKIINLENYPDNHVTIFDRWGSVLYKASRYDNQSVIWGGTNKNNNLVPNGTYFYVLEVTYGRQKIRKEGFIEVLQ